MVFQIIYVLQCAYNYPFPVYVFKNNCFQFCCLAVKGVILKIANTVSS